MWKEGVVLGVLPPSDPCEGSLQLSLFPEMEMEETRIKVKGKSKKEVWRVKLEKSLRLKRNDILLLASRHGAKNVRIFGSAARGEAGPESDVDFLVKMEDGRSLLDLSALVADLQDILGRKVDVVSEDGLYWLLRRKILKEAKPL